MPDACARTGDWQRFARRGVAVLALALAGASFAASAPAAVPGHPGQEIKNDAKDAGHAVARGARDVGHATRHVAVKIGHGARDAGKDVGHGARKAGHAVAHGVREGWRATRKAFKQAFGGG
ncbi:hypothetical protein [Oleiagrimonas sp. C23AA]|uniref:hypothetical protein n=1 Tax=Oleiagrimonas sp. C23AA TaxID=2719047 RepID=UPI00141FB57F|nr:hypothetical protein [Oleiagrimonas sp. C23AA]NII10430.1 hypothetical protein [Oleiagrimonas sp. C23AA]